MQIAIGETQILYQQAFKEISNQGFLPCVGHGTI